MIDCLEPNSPGAMQAARAYANGECIRLCDGRLSFWCKRKKDRDWVGSINEISHWSGHEDDV